MRRPLRPMPAPCKLCCYQVVWVEDVQNDKEMGYVRETCYCCVPTYGVFDTNDRKLYDIHQPTCCCGTCVNCCAGAGCCGRTPFHIYLAGDNDKLGEITKYFPTLVRAPASVHPFAASPHPALPRLRPRARAYAVKSRALTLTPSTCTRAGDRDSPSTCRATRTSSSSTCRQASTTPTRQSSSRLLFLSTSSTLSLTSPRVARRARRASRGLTAHASPASARVSLAMDVTERRGHTRRARVRLSGHA